MLSHGIVFADMMSCFLKLGMGDMDCQ